MRQGIFPIALGWQLVLVFVATILLLIGLIGWLQNVHILTTNGMYKSIQVEPWIADPAHAPLDPSNYLYFPLYGTLCRLLDAVGILRGVVWKQFAYLNAFWASLVIVFVYGFVHRLTGSAVAAILAACFHLGGGFMLMLSVINEDIMPGYALVLGAMVLAATWFDRPTHRRVALVGVVFTFGWLIEWRLMFPTLPALGLALVIAQEGWKQRLAHVATLLASILGVAGLVTLFWEGHNNAHGLHDILWTGKGVGSGWAGLGWDKAWMMLSGVGNSFLLMGGFVSSSAAKAAAVSLSISVVLQLAVLTACVAMLWARRADRRLWTVGAVFLGTLGAGQVMNIYSQPQDPQMQINVMPWLTVAWALLCAGWMSRRYALPILSVVSLFPLAWNIDHLSGWRGQDAKAVATLAAMERQLPPESTVFVYWGFEALTTWKFALWSHTWDWDGAATVETAPSANPRFKWIALNGAAIRRPQWTGEQHAASIVHDIDLALSKGYRVVASSAWNWSEKELAAQLGGLSASNRAAPIFAALHGSYDARPVFADPTTGTYYELSRRKP